VDLPYNASHDGFFDDDAMGVRGERARLAERLREQQLISIEERAKTVALIATKTNLTLS